MITKRELETALKGYEVKALTDSNCHSYIVMDYGIGIDTYMLVFYVFDYNDYTCNIGVYHHCCGELVEYTLNERVAFKDMTIDKDEGTLTVMDGNPIYL